MASGQPGAPGLLATAAAVLRMEIDAVLADWAWHLDHGELDDLAGLFTEDALFITGAVEMRGRAKIKDRYKERTVVRSTRHVYSGLRGRRTVRRGSWAVVSGRVRSS